ncbi:MAG: NADH dehydrogenase [Candidatus Kapaibacterium sp.]|nr:MAG: NADH dehydrogenase [Candidatus Kapabacteria bacterium]
MTNATPGVIIVGAGFGGLEVARRLGDTPLPVVLIDKTNHHLFQPLLYQVATAALSPADIAAPIRSIVRRYRNVTVLLDEVTAVNLEQQAITCRQSGTLPYTHLVLAPGSHHHYFGNDQWEVCAPGLKTLADALEIRRRILAAYEQADASTDPAIKQQWTTFVVVGGGPTGVEVAGALAEIGRYTMAKDFPALDPTAIRIVLIEAGKRILPAFPHQLSEKAHRALSDLGVEVQTNARVVEVCCDQVQLDSGESIPARTTIWAAGNRAPAFLRTLGVPLDPSGRVIVELDCSVPGYPNVFVIGDAACYRDPRRGELPALAPVALQQGRYVARIIAAGTPPPKRQWFRYRDKGMLATIGRAKAVATFPFGLRLNGLVAWLLWAAVHIAFLIRFRNRLAVLTEWLWYYLTFQPGARLLIEPRRDRVSTDRTG